MILIDAGPLVALATPEDQYHDVCAEALGAVDLPFVTTWPAITEAAWLVTRPIDFMNSIGKGCSEGTIELRSLEEDALGWIAAYMDRFRNIRAQLADASLMYVAEHDKIDTIFTLDRRDFSVYRTSKNRALKIIP